MEPIERFALWYPQNRVSPYILGKAATVLKQKDRSDLYLSLTKGQRALFDEHRKYRVRSFLLKTDYLKTVNWMFTDLRVNPYFPKPFKDGEKLVCECGRPLKYQFILQSIDNKKEIHLGVNHFADHLNLSLEVAREIQKGVNDVDIALDQLLLLKKRGQTFPEQQWQRYLFAIYQNVQLKNPVVLNQRLLARVFDFKKVDMPIYPADFQLLSDEIKQINYRVREEEGTKIRIDQLLFEMFKEDVEEDLSGDSWITHSGFFQKKLAPFSQINRYSKEEKEQFFQQLLDNLRKVDSSIQQNSFLSKELTEWIQKKFAQHKWQPNFFFILPRSIRNGLLKARRIEIDGRQSVLQTIFDTTSDSYIKHWLNLAFEPSVQEQPLLFTSYTELLFPPSKTGIDTTDFLQAMKQYQEGVTFEIAFQELPEFFRESIQKYFLDPHHDSKQGE